MKVTRNIPLPQSPLSPTPSYQEAAAYRLDKRLLDEAAATRDTVQKQFPTLEELDGTLADSDPAEGRVKIARENASYVSDKRDYTMHNYAGASVFTSGAVGPVVGCVGFLLGSVPGMIVGLVGSVALSLGILLAGDRLSRPKDESLNHIIDQGIQELDGQVVRSEEGEVTDFSLSQTAGGYGRSEELSFHTNGTRQTFHLAQNQNGTKSVKAEYDSDRVAVTLEAPWETPLPPLGDLSREGFHLVDSVPWRSPAPQPRTDDERRERTVRQLAVGMVNRVIDTASEFSRLDESPEDHFQRPGGVVLAQHRSGRGLNGELHFNTETGAVTEFKALVADPRGHFRFVGTKEQQGEAKEFYVGNSLAVVDYEAQTYLLWERSPESSSGESARG